MFETNRDYIPDSVEEFCQACFSGCLDPFRVTFGEASSLMVICSEVFFKCGLREIRIPDQVENLCDKCFYACKNLSCVTFGDLSSLKRIGRGCFRYSDSFTLPYHQASIPLAVLPFLNVLPAIW